MARILALLLCFGCACAPTPNPQAPEALVLAFPAEPVTLNPIFLADQISHTVSGLIFNGLTRFRPDLTITGDLATSWQLAADGKKITFFLRRGVQWHDGRKFTARD
uniref:ABC transporter substrate-binding protein n=1 Tax=Desulfobacca sp. TaxID=2067990 RepID=UPI004049B4FC